MTQDGVVLLHGIARTSRCMRALAKFLEAQGYATLNLDYPSRQMMLEDLVEHIRPAIAKFETSLGGKLHFVGYSMGNLLTRAYLRQYRPQRMGRMVMLAPPNQGSELADFLLHTKFYKKIMGPAGNQLVTDQSAFAHLFCEMDFEFGILAGNRPIEPLGALIIGAPNDGKVAVERTKLAGMTAHMVLPVSHTFIPLNRRVWRNTVHFLRHGAFESPSRRLGFSRAAA